MPAPRLPALVAVVIVFVAAGLRLVVADPGSSDLPNRLVPVLLAGAVLCVAGLTLRRGPALAWFAVVLAALIGAVEIVAVVRAWDPVPAGVDWLALTVLAAAASLGATFVAARYAVVQRMPLLGARIAWVGAWFGAALVVAGELWAIGDAAAGVVGEATGQASAMAEPDVVPVRVATRLMLGTVAVLSLVGAARDLVPPTRRAWHSASRGTASFPRRLFEELVPALAASRRAAAEEERATLAAELHARVVPELRSALAATAAVQGEGRLSERLRGTLDDLETLMAERHSVVLEEFGLLAALEWLAERIEARGAAEVTIEVLGPTDPVAGRPPRDAERAAFRVALLAVDNATQHAPGAVTIRTLIDPRTVAVDILDEGPGLDPSRVNEAARSGRRGLVDMRAEAAAVGASLAIADADPEDEAAPGVRVAFRWPSG